MASVGGVDHRALDGTSYHLDGELDLRLPCTSTADLVIGGRLVEFTAGTVSLGDDLAAALGISAFESELSFAGGTLRTATKREYDPRSKLIETPLLIAWQGERFSLTARMYGVDTREALGILRTLGIVEHPDGLTLSPDRSAGSGFARPASVVKEVPGLGLLEMSEPTREDTAQLPPWQGTAVGDGQLYRDTLSDGRPFFVLSGPRIWATVVPLADTVVERVPDLLSRLRLHMAE